MAEKKTWKVRVGAFIPRYVPNGMVAGAMKLLNVLHKTSKRKVEENRVHNTKVLVQNVNAVSTRQFFLPNIFIENQRQWGSVRFGSKYTMAYGGCEIFATYNALLALGQEMYGKDMVDLISWYERKGAAWAGRFGIAPRAAYQYFRKKGYKVQKTGIRKEESISTIGETYDTFIVTAYNDGQDIFRRIHTVNISKDTEGKYHAHNAFFTQENEKGEVTFVSQGPHETLWSAIASMSQGRAVPICVIGIAKEEISNRS